MIHNFTAVADFRYITAPIIRSKLISPATYTEVKRSTKQTTFLTTLVISNVVTAIYNAHKPFLPREEQHTMSTPLRRVISHSLSQLLIK
jgi:hypothetical protein